MKDEEKDLINYEEYIKLKKDEGYFEKKLRNYIKEKKGKDFNLKTKEEKQFLFFYGFFYGAYYGIGFGLFFAYYFKYRYRMKIKRKLFFILPSIFSLIFSISFGVYSAYLFDKVKIQEQIKDNKNNDKDND